MLNNKHMFFGVLMIFPMLGTSFYIHSMSLAVFSMVGYFFAFLYLLVCRSRINESFFLLSCFLVLSMFSALISAILIMADGFQFRANTFFGIAFGILYFLAIKELFFKLKSSQLNWLLCSALTFVLVFFYIQFFAYFLFGYDVDFMAPITGETQRLDGYVQETNIGMFKRVAGLFAEPAVHGYVVNVILMALCLRRALPLFLFILGIASIWLSFSASGILLSLIPIGLYFMSISAPAKVLAASVFTVFILFFSADLYMVFHQQMERISNITNDASGADRLRFLGYFSSNVDHLFFGFGVFTDIREVVPPSNFFVSVIYAFGLPSALVFLFVIVRYVGRYIGGFRLLLFLLYGVILNFPISSPFFWLNFSIVFMGVMFTGRNSIQKPNNLQKLSVKGTI